MHVGSLGEFGLIRRIRQKTLVGAPGQNLVMGIGDDTAIIEPPPAGHKILATIDMLLEGVHFDLSFMPPDLLGRKSLSVSISDIASMGGEPLACLISLGLPKDTGVSFVDRFYDGLLQVCSEAGCALAGGDTVSSRHGLVIDVAVLGSVPAASPWLRSRARVGDLIVVTGTLGDSAAGLTLLMTGMPSNAYPSLVKAHLNPTARLQESRTIRQSAQVLCAMDISDGLANEVNHIAHESGVGAVIYSEKIPISPECAALGAKMGKDPISWALYGGEDYELLFTISKQAYHALESSLLGASGTRLSVIGEVVEESQGVLITYGSTSCILKPKAFDHFRKD